MKSRWLNCLTINTDASFCSITKATGFAFRIVCDDFSINESGNLKVDVKGCTQAEMYCILNAMFRASSASKQHNIMFKRVVVNTDSLPSIGVISMLVKGKKKKKYNYLKINNIYKELKRFCHDIEFRHVKAHSGVNDKRSKCNEWCDVNAKIQMKKLRNTIINNNINSNY